MLNQISSEYKRHHEVQQDRIPETVKQCENKTVKENKATVGCCFKKSTLKLSEHNQVLNQISREPKKRRKIEQAGIVVKHLCAENQKAGKELENRYKIPATKVRWLLANFIEK